MGKLLSLCHNYRNKLHDLALFKLLLLPNPQFFCISKSLSYVLNKKVKRLTWAGQCAGFSCTMETWLRRHKTQAQDFTLLGAANSKNHSPSVALSSLIYKTKGCLT